MIDDTAAPWTLRKTDPKRMETVLYVLLEVLRKVTILYQPVIPESASHILDQLKYPKLDDYAHDTNLVGAETTSPITNSTHNAYSSLSQFWQYSPCHKGALYERLPTYESCKMEM